MLSIVGNIKISEPIRLKYLFATLKSYEFIKEYQLLLNIDTDIETFFKIDKFIREIGFTNFELSNLTGNYGEIYCSMLDKVNSQYVINFMEDQFMVIDNKDKLMVILKAMTTENVQVCKSSFYRIEQNSNKEILGHYDINYGLIYVNNKTNYNLYQKYYGSRYYIGVNFITTLSFANIFWNRMHTFKNLTRPHEWEISKYDANLECITMIPNIEIQCAIDDNHGEKGTCLLERKEDKFWNIYNAL